MTEAKTPAESRREARKEQRRLDIVDAALTVFARDGFALSKMDTVAEQAGISKGTLYLYFDSKEALFEGMVREKMLPTLEKLQSELVATPDASAEDMLRMQMRFFYRNVLNTERRHIMRLIMAEGPQFPHIAQFYYENVMSRGKALFKGIIEHGIRTGEFRTVEGHGLMKIAMAGGLVAALWKTIFDTFEPIDLEAYCETHIDVLLNGLKA
ncbi:TetR/AcrR family transcriptional regulator [Hyphomonas sp. FCG-A18]|uniref:TetR/AcrR family transcriptional regulator n=1 Tax=Hyphomonas sp. FCG-A18 TaxID=3080019 RepID=UPI002B2AC722|nr:TetR/AcrR family transcriptional regulator [Hyphomonas sp. FCG-A18]